MNVTLRGFAVAPLLVLATVVMAQEPTGSNPSSQGATNSVTQSAASDASTNMGDDMKPVMGWTSWDGFRLNASASKDEAEARAMVASGLAKLGYQYINQDDGWYVCPGGADGPEGHKSEGVGAPSVDEWGRWIPNERFPAQGSTNGIKALADYVHGLGLKFGIYLTPGISLQAVEKNTPVEDNAGGRLLGRPSGYTAKEITNFTEERNYNCGGMVGLDFSSPGAQIFLNSWADQLASWGVDFLKLDSNRLGNKDLLIAWSRALRQTGRPIVFDAAEGYTVKLAPVLQEYADQWMLISDIQCYDCNKGREHDAAFPLGVAFPLTTWSEPAGLGLWQGISGVAARFDYLAEWQPYLRPHKTIDPDAVDVGNGDNNGISLPARKTVLSLWSLASAPLLLGSDLRQLVPEDAALLKNRAVIAVDQDGIAARRVLKEKTKQVFTKREPGGDVIVGLFNTSTTDPERVSIGLSELGLQPNDTYVLADLWSHRTSKVSDQITADIPPEGAALFRVTVQPTKAPQQ